MLTEKNWKQLADELELRAFRQLADGRVHLAAHNQAEADLEVSCRWDRKEGFMFRKRKEIDYDET